MAHIRSLIPLMLLFLCACQEPGVQVPFTSQPPPSRQPLQSTATPIISPSSTQKLDIPTAFPTALPTLTPSPTLPPPMPAQYYIDDITGHKQFFPIGCEASTAVDWAAYFGTIINEFEFQYRLPLSDNPEKGFVGGVGGPWGQVPPYSYGVHAAPVAALLEEYGLNARAVKGMTLEEVKAQVSADKPVIAWVIGNVVGGIPFEYVDLQLESVIVAAYEHTVIITGYNQDKIRYMNNGRFYETPSAVFLNSWGVLGYLAVVRQ